MEQLEGLLRRRLSRSYSGVRTGTTHFDVTLARLRTNQIYVVGEVLQPGAYQLSSVATVLNALYAAGGLTERANFRSVAVRRGDDTVAVMDVYDYVLHGNAQQDVMLEQGDVVFVPTQGPRASISGAIVRPAVYALASNETLADLVAMAGGLTAKAETRRLAIHRILPAADRQPGPYPRAVIDVPLGIDGEASGTGEHRQVIIPDLRLEDGDSVVVDSIPDLRESLYVTASGMVKKPGRYAWNEGMTLRDLVSLARGTRIGADLREAELARLPADRRSGAMVVATRVPLDSTYLFERDSVGRYVGPAGLSFPAAGSAPEVLLEPFDQVTIFRQPEFELQRTVWITGEVRFPGPYALRRKDERVSDLLERAGGVLATAYEDGARFYRTLDDAGRIDIDMAAIRARPRSAGDIVLQPGDSLNVPEFIPTVRVDGAVVSPTSVLYRAGANLDYYVANAGGYARNADRGRVSVRFANGSAEVKRTRLFLSTAPVPGPGSVVVVPEIPAGEGVNTTELLGTIAQILTSAVAIIAIATR
jgi:protein involved in polysaccharide export with SLBB domain